MAAPAKLPSLASAAVGEKFSSFILGKYGMPVAPSAPSAGAFALLVALGRCCFRVDESFVASTLSAILGDLAEHFHVSLIEDRIFLFSISSRAIGCEIYRIRKFVYDELELSFHLFNDSGLASARSFSSNLSVFPWVEVRKKSSYADMVKKTAAVLTGANRIRIRSPPVRQNATSKAQRKSVFDHLSFLRISVFDRLGWDPRRSVKHQVFQKQFSQPISNSSAMERIQCSDHNSHGLSVERDELRFEFGIFIWGFQRFS